MLQQSVVRGGDGLDQLVVVAVHRGLQLWWAVSLFVLPGLRPWFVKVGAPGKQVDDAPKVLSTPNGNFHRNHLGRQVLADVLINALEVGVLPVHHRNKQDGGEVALFQHLPHPLGSHLDPGRSREAHDGAIRHPHARARFAQKVQVAGGVQEVDLGVHPVRVRHRHTHGDPVGDLLRAEHGERGSVGCGAMSPGRPGGVAACIDQRCLSGGAVTHDDDVADAVGCERGGECHEHLQSWKGRGWVEFGTSTGSVQVSYRSNLLDLRVNPV